MAEHSIAVSEEEDFRVRGRKRYPVNSLFVKLSAIVILGIIAVTLAVTYIVINISTDIFIDTYGESQEKVFARIEEELNTFYENTSVIMDQINDDWPFRVYLSDTVQNSAQEYSTVYQVQRSLKSAIPNGVEDVSVLVVGKKGKTIVGSGKGEAVTVPANVILGNRLTKRLNEKPGTLIFSYMDQGFTSATRNTPVIIGAKALIDTGGREPYAYVYVTMKESDFEKMYRYFTSDTSDIEILDRDSRVVSSEIKALLGKKDEELRSIAGDLGKDGIERKNVKRSGVAQTLLIRRLSYYDMCLIGTIDNSRALSNLYDMPQIIVITTLISLVVLLIILFVIRQTMRPLQMLTKKMADVREGNFDLHTEVEGTGEIRELSETFNYMLDDLNSYVDKLVEVQKDKRNAEIHALQMQINPHYVFNTLASIKWLILQGDTERSTKTIDAFIHLLRSTIYNTDEFIGIGQEVENLKDYVFINNTRYGENVQVEFFVAPDCDEYKIPKLILQPFIENAFFHAFPDGRRGEIQIFISLKGDQLRFEISDNGIGMNQEQLLHLQTSKGDGGGHFSGIGIANVDERIRLIYGLDYGLNITSEPEQGTRVLILLPQKPNKS